MGWRSEAEDAYEESGIDAVARQFGCRTAAEDREVTRLLVEYDRIVARLEELGVDVHVRDRMNEEAN